MAILHRIYEEFKMDIHLCTLWRFRLCESYGVREANRKRMLGHSVGNGIINGVYRQRCLEELRTEIEKIKVPETVDDGAEW